MKQSIYTFPTAFCLLLCTACTQADTVVPDPGVEEGVPLGVKNLGLSVEVESRSIATGGSGVGSAINPNPLTGVGVCVTNAKGVYYDNGNRTQQFAYNAQAGAWEQAADGETLLLFSEKGTVYGFSPVEKSISVTGSPKQPVMGSVKVLDKQTFIFNDGGNPVDAAADIQWETSQDDYLYGTATADQPTVDRWHPEVSLQMWHALAKVSFRVLETEGGMAFAGNGVKKVVLKSGGGFNKSTSAKLNLATGELGGSMTAVGELWFTAGGDQRSVGTNYTDVKEVAIQAFGLVIPVTGVSVTLELTLDDDRVFTMSPVAGTFTADWVKGSNYIYNIKISPQGIAITNVEVAGWNEGGSTDVPVE